MNAVIAAGFGWEERACGLRIYSIHRLRALHFFIFSAQLSSPCWACRLCDCPARKDAEHACQLHKLPPVPLETNDLSAWYTYNPASALAVADKNEEDARLDKAFSPYARQTKKPAENAPTG